ncbi:hypothetical protein K505DRAFT_358265 [Melanomma pulvis-pyrius CBS 109.77]|uniref:Uncharacterized protein n=1 Tax=Melanomma pulvis-pyrius CBS 109.77 TaxID=1314802 RepID=A0A6A6XMV8_9PLEO|nr:hypothetical protein K505DRAFT_358265 [Melanomma pulvis-pyrius CBS 109.77]
MDNATVVSDFNSAETSNVPIPFNCIVPTKAGWRVDGQVLLGQHRMAICQLGTGGNGLIAITGGLTSEFFDETNPTETDQPARISDNWKRGTAYVLLNVTFGDEDRWRDAIQEGANPPATTAHGAWQDLLYADAQLILSVSLCYAAFNTAELPVRISSIANRTEPLPLFKSSRQTYDFSDIRKQYDQDRTLNNVDRGILDLAPVRSSWLAQPDELPPVEPWIRASADMYQGIGGSGSWPNTTAVLWQSYDCQLKSGKDFSGLWVCPSLMHVLLFQEILRTGGSPAFAVQALITSLANLAYYDQLAQFDKLDEVAQGYWITSNIAVQHTGFLAIATVMGFHLALVIICLYMFLSETKWSIMGNTWCAIAQLVNTQMIEFWGEAANGATVNNLRRMLEGENRSTIKVGIGEDASGLVGLRKRFAEGM